MNVADHGRALLVEALEPLRAVTEQSHHQLTIRGRRRADIDDRRALLHVGCGDHAGRGRGHAMTDAPVVLGIETSCDETGIGIVRGHDLLANEIATSVEEHARFGGVVPEVASRAHLEAMPATIERALAHQDPDPVRRAYARGSYWEERVQMAQWWADYLDSLRNGGNVVPMRIRRA